MARIKKNSQGKAGVQAIPSHAAGEGGRRPTIGKLTKGIRVNFPEVMSRLNTPSPPQKKKPRLCTRVLAQTGYLSLKFIIKQYII